MAICYLGIGSNLGNRQNNIKTALKKIKGLEKTKIIKSSKLIETPPVGGPSSQKKFLNAVLKVKTHLAPLSFLRALKSIEYELGRPKRYLRNSARTIDLDILFYGNKKINQKELKIPHPKVFSRDFVMRPLLEVL
ncbi:MAG: 2-amino-4-hydroxy-6-hydroxymethyldihydropteridine diphosphokinase [Candidatus Omnitrophica bacterium]|nr:2-amino-4-hydroxy-6-hydroxymethyldihydropteridine diphosphokinase [Candidatus Omnitrophota bacterium]